MDNLDKISVVLLIVLASSLVVLGMDYQDEAASGIQHVSGMRGNVDGVSEIPAGTIKKLRDLLATDNVQKADPLGKDLLNKHPYEGEPYMLMGDIMMRKQELVAAINAYKEAVDLNPDYVDKKTPLFQGRKIKVAIDETKDMIHAALSENPVDKKIKKSKKTMYYLLRKLAGSCG